MNDFESKTDFMNFNDFFEEITGQHFPFDSFRKTPTQEEKNDEEFDVE